MTREVASVVEAAILASEVLIDSNSDPSLDLWIWNVPVDVDTGSLKVMLNVDPFGKIETEFPPFVGYVLTRVGEELATPRYTCPFCAAAITLLPLLLSVRDDQVNVDAPAGCSCVQVLPPF